MSLAPLQRLTSHTPGLRSLKVRLRNHVGACGLVYRFARTRQASTFTVLLYHRVLERPDAYYPDQVEWPVFEAQMAFLKRCCAVLSLDEILDRLDNGRALPQRCVALTFDDGYRDFSTLAWPLLNRLRLPVTVFVTVQALERGGLWSGMVRHLIRQTDATSVGLEALPSGPRTFDLTTEQQRLLAVRELNDTVIEPMPSEIKARVIDELAWKLTGRHLEQVALNGLMLSWDELKTLSRDGVTVGSHALTHPILTRLPYEEARQEIARSRQVLEERLGIPVAHFAYPYGRRADYSPGIQRLVQAAGYRSACANVYGINEPASDRFALKRICGPRASLRTLVRAMTCG